MSNEIDQHLLIRYKNIFVCAWINNAEVVVHIFTQELGSCLGILVGLQGW